MCPPTKKGNDLLGHQGRIVTTTHSEDRVFAHRRLFVRTVKCCQKLTPLSVFWCLYASLRIDEIGKVDLTLKPQQAWDIAHNQLEIQYDRASFNTWIKDISFLEYHPDELVFVLGVRNTYILDMLNHRMRYEIQQVLRDVFEQNITIRFETRKKEQPQFLSHTLQGTEDMPLFNYMAQQPPEPEPETKPSLHQRVQRPRLSPPPESDLNPRFDFDRFIVNKANSMVYEAARAVAENPNGAYNPLMIYGGVGLGKTHLLQAIANDCHQRGLHVIYVPSEAFVNDLVMSIRKRQQAMFRDKYRRADVLLMDDVQFISGKEGTQEEFFHTFNALYTFNKQIVLASDRHPDELTTLEDRLRSRFAGGLVVDVQPPQFETRVAILEMWTNERGIDLGRDVLETVAHKAPDNIRELEGVFNQVVAKARFSKSAMDVEQVTRTLNRFEQPRNHARPVTLKSIAKETASVFELDAESLFGKRRTKQVTLARQVAMYLGREFTDASLLKIGKTFGGRTHSTVLHSCNKIVSELEKNTNLQSQIETVRANLFGD